MADPIKPPVGYTLDAASQSVTPPPGYTLDAPRTQAPPMDAYRQPDGSAAARVAKGWWDYTGGGLWDMVKGLTSIAANSGRPMIDPNSAGGQMIQNIVQSHVDQAEQAKDALDRKDYVEAFGHTLAAALPFIGPAAARIGDKFGGTEAKFDKYGNVIQQGVAPDIAGGIGNILGLATSMAVPEIAKKIPISAPAVTRPIVKSTLNPVQQAAVDFLRENDVPLNAGTVTGNKFVQGAQKLAASTPLGSGIAADATRATEAGLQRVASDLADQTHPDPATLESVGRVVPEALQDKIADLGTAENAGYEKAWQGRNDPKYTYKMQVGTQQVPTLDSEGKPTGAIESAPLMKPVNMPVDVQDIKAALKPVYAEMQWMPASDRSSSAGYQAVKNILEGDDYIPAWQAEKGLSGLKTMARVTSQSGVRNASQGIGASIIPDLQDSIDAAVANTGDDAIRGLQQGRALHASKMDVADLADKLRAEPVQALNQLTWKNDTGIDFLRKINDQAPQTMPQIGRAFITQLFDKAQRDGGFSRTQSIFDNWQNLGPATKRLLYPNPSLRTSLDNFFQGAKLAAENPNPSGTALVGQTTSLATEMLGSGVLMLQNPMAGAAGLAAGGAYLLGGRAAAKLFYSPAGVRLLTGGLKAEAPGAAAMRASQILRIAGDDDVTPTGPGGGTPPAPRGGPNPSAAAADKNNAAVPVQSSTPGAASSATLAPGAPSNVRPQTAVDAGTVSPVDAGGTGGRPATGEAARPGSGPGAAAAQTEVSIPGSPRRYQARYEVRELSDIQPSHNGQTFQPNPNYQLVNDRDYARSENQGKVLMGSGPEFHPSYHLTDNPDPSNGPPLVDESGNVYGGNGRAMMLQRVYAGNAPGAAAYRQMLTSKAQQFGVDPQQVAGMKQPVLVRVIPDTEMATAAAKQQAVTDFNKTGTAALRGSEKAIADSRRVYQTYSPQAVALAKTLQGANPTELTKAARQYAQDAAEADQGNSLFGEPPTPAESFDAAFRPNALKLRKP